MVLSRQGGGARACSSAIDIYKQDPRACIDLNDYIERLYTPFSAKRASRVYSRRPLRGWAPPHSTAFIHGAAELVVFNRE